MMTDGRRQLLRALQITTTIEVGLRVGVTHQAVSYWANGERKPSPRSRAALAEHVWITGSWEAPRTRQP
jgi:transcriptional regulator with XRE-family HTH domain